MSRRHKLAPRPRPGSSAAWTTSCQLRASARAAALLAELGGGRWWPGCSYASAPIRRGHHRDGGRLPRPGGRHGLRAGTVIRRLEQVGCEVTQSAPGRPRPPRSRTAAAPTPATTTAARPVRDVLTVVPPSWRPDLTDPTDLAEEVIRLEGYEQIPVRAPRAAAGRGLTDRQRLRRTDRARAGRRRLRRGHQPPVRVGRRLRPAAAARRGRAAAGAAGWPTRSARTSRCCAPRCCPACSGCSARNIGRGFADLALFETGPGVPARPDGPKVAPMPGVDQAPSRRGGRRWRPRCPTSRCTWPWCWPATASCPAGGAGRRGWVAGRHRGGAAGARGQPGAASRSGPTSRSPGTPAGAPR